MTAMLLMHRIFIFQIKKLQATFEFTPMICPGESVTIREASKYLRSMNQETSA